MVESLTLSDRVYRDLRKMIISGELAPGTKLVQRQLASVLGVSSIPVLEATRRLESDGLVEYFQGVGARVKTWDDDDIAGIFLFREVLETTAARLFAEKATPVDRMILADYGERFDKAVTENDEEACVELDQALHLHIVKCSNSSTLLRYAENSCVHVAVIHRDSVDDSQPLGPVGVHSDLIAALSGDDPDVAAQAAKEHIGRAHYLLSRPAKQEIEVS